MTPRDLLRRRFGLSDEEPFELLGVVELPAGDVEHGLSGQTPGAPAVDELLADQLFDAPDLVSVDPGIDRLELSLSAWETDPRVLVLESPGVPLHIAGQVELLRGTDWAVDSRGPGGALAVLDGDRVVAVVGEGGSFRIERIPVDPPDDPLLERLRRFEPSDVGPVEVPAPERWTAGLDPPTWLMTVARGLHSRGGSLGRLASAGLVARHNGLCYPSAKVALQARMSGDKAPIHRVLDWAKGLGPDALADLSERAAEAIDALAEALVMHRAVAVRDPDAAARRSDPGSWWATKA